MNALIRLNPLLVHLAIPLLTGAAAIYLSGGMAAAGIIFPAYAPSPAVFVLVWAVLLLLMGASAYLVYTDKKITRTDRNCSMTLYGFMLVMTCVWSVLFFRYRLFLFSALWAVVILVVTALCTALFYKVRPAAGGLMVPVLPWLIFGAVLNFSVASLN